MNSKVLTVALIVSLLLTACSSLPTPTPTPHPTVTASGASEFVQEFTARIVVGAVNVIRKDTLYLGGINLQYVADEQGNVTQPTDYESPLCYMAPSGLCQEEGARDLLFNSVTLSIESGHWCADKIDTGYTAPEEC